jgi:hypothetical protein
MDRISSDEKREELVAASKVEKIHGYQIEWRKHVDQNGDS